ncbi:hypothetical protein JOF56_011564 [Kibdelosporangium banguiense]|uniref:Uncharacterized protein n=1 Tax=Kibdelosporangium banguiense TaxID=1365924 RepID=A0ABS4U4Q0_9PSEU|nr:hypothetical protein [Kibdelosporangium banguiense]MBP2331179.1 hypothetical protein [Kibdelosporangium banguiense]
MGQTFDNGAGDFATLVWDLSGHAQPVRIDASAREWFIDSRGTVVGNVAGDINFYRSGVLKDSIKGTSVNALGGFTDTGVVAGNKWNPATSDYLAVTYKRSC